MKKISRKLWHVLLMVVLIFVLVIFMFPATVSAAVNAVTPSTNDINRTNGWSHFNVKSVGVGEATIEFVQPRGFMACFEYRTDGDLSQSSGANYNPGITDGLYPFFCLGAPKAPQPPVTRTETITATSYIEIRMVFGGEEDERFDWTRVDVLPAPEPPPAATIYTITASTDDRGIITDEGTTSMSQGSSKTYSMDTESTDCGIVRVLVDGVSIGKVKSYTFTDVNANHTIHVIIRCWAPVTTEEVEVLGITEEVEVLGITEELPFTGQSMIFYIIGALMLALAGGLTFVLRAVKSKE